MQSFVCEIHKKSVNYQKIKYSAYHGELLSEYQKT